MKYEKLIKKDTMNNWTFKCIFIIKGFMINLNVDEARVELLFYFIINYA